MSTVITYISMLIFFLIVDSIVIIKFMNPMFRSNIGEVMKEDINFAIAGIFYLFYVVGIYWFGTYTGLKANSILIGVASAAFLGLLAYGTYEITNFVVIKGWTPKMVIIDVIWGGFLSGMTALVGILVNRLITNT